MKAVLIMAVWDVGNCVLLEVYLDAQLALVLRPQYLVEAVKFLMLEWLLVRLTSLSNIAISAQGKLDLYSDAVRSGTTFHINGKALICSIALPIILYWVHAMREPQELIFFVCDLYHLCCPVNDGHISMSEPGVSRIVVTVASL